MTDLTISCNNRLVTLTSTFTPTCQGSFHMEHTDTFNVKFILTSNCFEWIIKEKGNSDYYLIRLCIKFFSGITTGPVPGNLTSPGNKRIVDAKTVYILVSIGAILLILLIVSTTYLFLKRKKRLAMETILKDRVTFSVNDYSNPSFRRFSNEFILTNDNQPRQRSMYSIRVPGDGQVNNSDTPRNDVNIQNHQFNGSLPKLPTNPPNHPGDQSLRISNASNESLNSNVSTGWTNPLFLNAREPDNNRPATYAMIEEDCYSGSNLSGIYASIPECVQTLEGFDVGESNDYDSFSSDEFEQEAVYENGFVTPVKQPIEIKSVYLHTPCQSTQYLSIPFPIQEENNYEYVSDNCDKVDQNNELEYDYVANDDDEMFSNRNSSGSSQLETKAAADDDVYEDTDSPNTTLDTTVDDEHDADNSSQTYNYAFDENPHKYDYAENPEANEYYEDGTSIDLQLNDPQDEYDYVSSANVRQSLENINNSDTISQRQSSVDEEYTGPTTYYDDAILLAMSGDLDNYPDCLGELPEYEYVRNSNITEVSDSTNRISDSSDSTFAGGDKANRSSAVSYASIDGSDTEVSADEHDYDEISKHTADSVNNESEGEYDSDYEKVSDVFGRNSKVMNDFAEEQQKYENPKLKFQNFGAGKGSSIIIVDNEPVYDEVCAPGTSSGNDQDR